MDVLQQWGVGVILLLQRLSPGLDQLMLFLSFLGQEEFFLVFTAFLYWCVNPAWGLRVLAVLTLSDSVNGILKWTFHEPRPYWVAPQVKALSAESSYGIPSGHAQTGVAFWGMLATVVRQPWAWAAAVGLVFAISISRLYLGVHFPHDLVAGWIIGALLLIAYLWIEPRAGAWLRSKPLAAQIGAAFAASAVLAGIGLLVRAALAGTIDPAAWAAQAAAAAPHAAGELAIDPRSLGSVATWGAIFGVGAGWALARRFARFNAGGPWSTRLIRLGLGLTLLLGVRIGLAVAFPSGSDALALVFRYIRYAIMGLSAVWLAPWLFLRIGLARPATE
jgi:membrane-associated phospholipid phosphatase